MKIVADSDIPFLNGVLEPFAQVVYMRGEAIGARDVADADALVVRTRTRCDAALLSGSRVRLVATATIGFDHIDTDYLASQSIEVATAAGSNARGVLQWWSAALAWLASHDGAGWGSAPETADDFPSRKTLGVVGVGHVGSLVAHYARSWGFRVMCSDPPRERAEGLGPADGFYPLQALVNQCDIISLHVPLTHSGTDETHHLVDRDFLAQTRPNAVIINSSRGAIIDPAALCEAVLGREQMAVSGDNLRPDNHPRFIIDTWNNEPAIDRDVLERVLLATPHIAGYSIQGKATATAMVVNELAQKFGIKELQNWYPAGVLRSSPREISWARMCRTMPAHFDIAAQGTALKAAPELFEQFRSRYTFREEYF